MTAFLLDTELEQDFREARAYTDQWQEAFPEYERLAANLPSPDLPDHYSKVTDGTYSALLSERHMRVWGQLQSGHVVALPNGYQDYPEWKARMVDIIWSNRIVKNANTQAPFFEKLRATDKKAGTYGSQPLFVFPVNTRYYTGADFTLVNPRDVKYPSGYVSALDAPRLWLIRRYDKVQLRGVIEAAKSAPNNNGWVIEKLEEIYNSNAFTQQTDDLSLTQEDKATLGNKVEFATCYHRGTGNPWITLYPKGNNEDHNIIRRETNYFPTGDIPIVVAYNEQDFVNPCGVSEAERAGPSQNVVDLFTAGHTVAVQKAIDPAIQVKGDANNDENLDLSTLITSPGNLMFTGNVELEEWTPDKTILAAFPDQIASYKTNVMNQLGTGDGTVSAQSSGNSMYSKVPASIKMQQERTNSKDNYHRQTADQLVSDLARVMINMTIQLTSGTDIIDITKDQRSKLVAAGYEVPEDASKVIAEFEELKDGDFDFVVDAGSSKLEDDDATKQAIGDAIESTVNIPELDARLAKEGKKFNLSVLLASYYEKSGLDNVDKVITDLDPAELEALNNPPQSDAIDEPSEADILKTQQEEEKLTQEQLKTQEQQAKAGIPGVPVVDPSQETKNDDEIVAARLRAEGWSDEDIQQYFERERSV